MEMCIRERWRSGGGAVVQFDRLLDIKHYSWGFVEDKTGKEDVGVLIEGETESEKAVSEGQAIEGCCWLKNNYINNWLTIIFVID